MTDVFPVDSPLGELSIDEILVSYDGPKLFTCTNQLGNWYVALSVDESDDGATETFLYAPTEEADVRAITRARMPLREAFVEPAEPHVWVVVMNYVDGSSQVYPKLASDLDDAWLPSPGAVLEPPNTATVDASTNTHLSRYYGSDSALAITLYSARFEDGDATGGLVKCRVGVSLRGQPIWGNSAEPSDGVLVDAGDICLFFGRNWIHLALEEGLPNDMALGTLEHLREAFRSRRARLPFGARRSQEESLERFYDAHDLARAVPTTALPSVLLVRQGLHYWALTEQSAERLRLADVLLPLEQFVGDIVDVLVRSGSKRYADAVEAWQSRWEADKLVAASLATRRSKEDLEILGEKSSALASAFQGRVSDFAESEILAAARLSRGLSADHTAHLLNELARLPKSDDVEVLDRISSAVVSGTKGYSYAYDEGLGAARVVRDQLGIANAEPVDPRQLLEDALHIVVKKVSLRGASSLDAFSAWGPRFGPAVVLNTNGFHNQGHGVNATLAHEMGHLLMDRHGALPLVDVLLGSQRNDVEARARAFAAELLLPQEVARERQANWTGSIKSLVRRLSREFRVSAAVAAWNVYNAGTQLSAEERAGLRGIAGSFVIKLSPAIENDE